MKKALSTEKRVYPSLEVSLRGERDLVQRSVVGLEKRESTIRREKKKGSSSLNHLSMGGTWL